MVKEIYKIMMGLESNSYLVTGVLCLNEGVMVMIFDGV
jgi:hypothetical protein